MTQHCFVDRRSDQQFPLVQSSNSRAHELMAAVGIHLAHQRLL